MVQQDGAHVDLTAESFQIGGEAMQHWSEFPDTARSAHLFHKTLARFPIFEHEVAQASFVEDDKFLHQPLGRLSALLFLRSPDELRERPKVSAQGERLFELGLKCVEKLRAFDGRIKKLCETDC